MRRIIQGYSSVGKSRMGPGVLTPCSFRWLRLINDQRSALSCGSFAPFSFLDVIRTVHICEFSGSANGPGQIQEMTGVHENASRERQGGRGTPLSLGTNCLRASGQLTAIRCTICHLLTPASSPPSPPD
jgi:hypothetical protein